VLQERRFRRVGGLEELQADIRFIAATNQDLTKRVAEGRFREDLFYRINVIPIVLPPLRERREDIPLVAEHFLAKYNDLMGKQIAGISKDAMELLVRYAWPGNIRELENVIERALLFADGARIRLEDLAYELRGASLPDAVRASSPPLPSSVQASISGAEDVDGAPASEGDGLKEQVKAAMSRLERELIIRALSQTQNNVTHAARLLKISRKGLQLKMKELNLRERDPE